MDRLTFQCRGGSTLSITMRPQAGSESVPASARKCAGALVSVDGLSGHTVTLSPSDRQSSVAWAQTRSGS